MAINNYKHNLNEPLVVKDLQITGNTSIGIGTASPAAKTHIAVNVGITTALILEQISGNAVGADLKVTYPGQTTATSRIVFDFFGNEFSAASHGMNYVSGRFSNSNHWFRNASNATQMVMNNAGNLLIGTETDSGTANQRLQVTGGAYFAGVGVATGSIGVGITNPQGTIDIRTSPQWGGTNIGANLVIGGSRNNGIGILDFTNSNPWSISNAAGNLLFSQMPALGDTANVPTEAARITTNRNLLIGSTSETGTSLQRLQVTGGAYVSGGVGIGVTNPQNPLHISGSAGTLLRIDGGAAGTGTRDIVITEFNTDAYGGIIRYDSIADLFTFGTLENSVVQYALNVKRSNGNIGIGTTIPTSPLHVVGSTLITGITTVGLGTTSTPPSNSQMSFELTSDTNLSIKVRGTDGVLRSANITLT